MANELRMSSVGQTGSNDTDDFIIGAYDEDGALQHTVLRIPVAGYQSLTPDDAEGADVNVINPGVTQVVVGANVNGVNDFIVLPSLADVPNGHTITVVSNAAGHEVRTPAASNEEINSEDCDGTKEYAIAAGGQIHRFTKISDAIGWMGQGYTAIGAAVTAVVPD